MAVLPAALLTKNWVTYKNVPETSDIEKILILLKDLGAEIKKDKKQIKICCKKIKSYKVNQEIGETFRSSLMFAGPLLARLGKAEIPLPGGCDLGYRGIEAHVSLFKKVGIKVQKKSKTVLFYEDKNFKQKNVEIFPLESSVTGTENLLMYASNKNINITLNDSASEPHVFELEEMLSRMGANISGVGSNKIKISGNKNLKGTIFNPAPDFVDIGGIIVATAITNGRVLIKDSNIKRISGTLIEWFRLFNIVIEEKKKDLLIYVGTGGLKYIEGGFPLAGKNLFKLSPRPWPGFPVDLIPVMATLACKTKGRLVLQNWMYEDALNFTRELNILGADILISNPQSIVITGPVKFNGGEVTPPKVIQAIKAVFLAALADKKTTLIHNTDFLRRRYPNIVDAYNKLGADISFI